MVKADLEHPKVGHTGGETPPTFFGGWYGTYTTIIVLG